MTCVNACDVFRIGIGWGEGYHVGDPNSKGVPINVTMLVNHIVTAIQIYFLLQVLLHEVDTILS
jgi:hypothetical protein